LINWIDRNIPHPDIDADDSEVFIGRLIGEWQNKGWPLGRLVRERFPLRDLVEKSIDTCRHTARAKAFQEVLFAEASGPITVSAEKVFTYDPDRYPARWICARSDDFKKHYHRQVGELGEKGEEFDCALFLDQLPEVAVWVRNLERQPDKSFWLPTATDRFYPDFVCQLTDGRILVVEYKGDHLWTNDDSKEKRRLGELWAERSGGREIFVMPRGPKFSEITTALRQPATTDAPRRKHKFAEHALVKLTRSLTDEGTNFPAGAVGTVISVYRDGEAYAVELERSNEHPVIVTLRAIQLESAP
jgi:type III restriction enzyme